MALSLRFGQVYLYFNNRTFRICEKCILFFPSYCRRIISLKKDNFNGSVISFSYEKCMIYLLRVFRGKRAH